MNQKKLITTDNGFIQLHRNILDWEWYQDINTKVLFMHLLLRANYKDNRYQGTLVKRGSHLTSYGTLANETGLSVKNVRTALDRLVKTGEVAKLSTPLGTSVSVVNYDLYQGHGQAIGKLTASLGQTNGKPSATNNNSNKENKDNNINLPCVVKVSDKDLFISSIEDHLQKPLSDWLGYSKKLKTRKQWEFQYKKLKGFNNPQETVDNSIGNGYQGLYEPKTNNNYQNKRSKVEALNEVTQEIANSGMGDIRPESKFKQLIEEEWD